MIVEGVLSAVIIEATMTDAQEEVIVIVIVGKAETIEEEEKVKGATELETSMKWLLKNLSNHIPVLLAWERSPRHGAIKTKGAPITCLVAAEAAEVTNAVTFVSA